MLRPIDPPKAPELWAKVSKKLNTLTFKIEGKTFEHEIVDGEIDLIKLDEMMTKILLSHYDRTKLQQSLSGKRDILLE